VTYWKSSKWSVVSKRLGTTGLWIMNVWPLSHAANQKGIRLAWSVDVDRVPPCSSNSEVLKSDIVQPPPPNQIVVSRTAQHLIAFQIISPTFVDRHLFRWRVHSSRQYAGKDRRDGRRPTSFSQRRSGAIVRHAATDGSVPFRYSVDVFVRRGALLTVQTSGGLAGRVRGYTRPGPLEILYLGLKLWFLLWPILAYTK